MANGDENKKNLEEQKKLNQAKKEAIGLNQETKKELLSQREALNEILKQQKGELENKREILGLSRDLAKLTAEELTFKEQSNKFIRSESDLAAALLKTESIRNELKEKAKEQGKDISKNLQAQLDTTKDVENQLKKQIAIRQSINKNIGVTDNLLRGIEQIPFLKEFIDGEAAIAAAEAAMINTKDESKKAGAAMTAAIKNLKRQLRDAVVDLKDLTKGFLAMQGINLFGQMFEALKKVSGESVEAQKALGLSNKASSELNFRLTAVALNARNTSISINDVRNALMTVNDQLGIATTAIRDDIVEEMAILAKTTGLSAEAQGNFAKDAILSGKNAATITKEARSTVEAQVKQFGLGVNVNKVLDEAGQITGVMAANFGFSIERLAKAVTVSKQLGMSLEATSQIQGNMLDFASSIENELAAELFTNKQLNLEKARLYALTNNIEGLQKEIQKNFPSLIEFEKMNYLARERTAAALGMSADALADMIRGNKTNRQLAEEARAAGEKEMAAEYEKLALSEEFAAAQERVFGSLAMMIEPLLPIIEAFAKLLQQSELIYSIMGLFAAVKLGGLFVALKGIAVTLGLAAAKAGVLSAILTGGLALGILAVAVPAMIGAMNQIDSLAQGKNDLSPMDVAQIQKGEVRAHSGESLIRTNTLEALLNKVGGGNQQQNMQPVVLSVNYSGFDAVKAPTHYNSSIR